MSSPQSLQARVDSSDSPMVAAAAAAAEAAHPGHGISIRQAVSRADMGQVAQLFTAYTTVTLAGIDLSFQNYAAEVASLPGAYAPPRGALLLAFDRADADGDRDNGGADAEDDAEDDSIRALGCLGVRALPHDIRNKTSNDSKSGTDHGNIAKDGKSDENPQNLQSVPTEKICEAKRLYVEPHGRGKGVALALMQTGMAAARRAGFTTMLLDTLQTMTAARTLYRRLGFTETDPYYFNPHPGVVFMQCDLTRDAAVASK